MCFLLFLWLYLWFSWISSVKSSKIVTSHRFQRDTNFKHEKSRVCKGSFFDIFKFMSSTAAKKPGLLDFPEKQAPTKVKYLLPICQILRNFTEGNARKFTVSFASCAHVDVIKYRKTRDVFLWARADYFLSARAIIKLWGATLRYPPRVITNTVPIERELEKET